MIEIGATVVQQRHHIAFSWTYVFVTDIEEREEISSDTANQPAHMESSNVFLQFKWLNREGQVG